MMKEKVVASHQPHFFPWLGYLDKMAKSDVFIINDIAQVEKKSPMVRNRILDCRGIERYINVSIEKNGCFDKPNKDIKLSGWNNSRIKLKNVIVDAYKKAEYFEEIWPLINKIISDEHTFLFDVNMATIEMLRTCFEIQTPIVLNSSFCFDNGENKSERVANKVAAIGGTVYLSGNGARKYMNFSEFEKKKIRVIYQRFSYPVYSQFSASEFISNLSALDMLFNCGIEKSRTLFWKNVKENNELLISSGDEPYMLER